MDQPSIDIILENENLKNEFAIRGLDLSQIWDATPENPALENRQLRYLLDWVEVYQECPVRAKLEARGYLFPPISHDIDPDSDWYRFELWMKGLPTRKTLSAQLSPHYKIRPSEEIPEEQIEAALDELVEELEKINCGFAIRSDIPARLSYEDLLDFMEEEHEIMGSPGWVFDGCSGYCPGCFQRPWCESGCNCCWDEDQEAGQMVFPEFVKRYVSPAPMSLAILQARQAEEDRQRAEFRARDGGGEIKLAKWPGVED
jgi:hypothetical protein